MKSRSRILGGVAAKRVVTARFNIDEWSKPTMSSSQNREPTIIMNNQDLRNPEIPSIEAVKGFLCLPD